MTQLRSKSMPDRNRSNFFGLQVTMDLYIGQADDDEAVERYRDVDLDDNAQARAIIAAEIRPHLRNFLSQEERLRIYVALQLSLATDAVDFGRLFDSSLPPFDAPQNAKRFYELVLEEGFRGDHPSGESTR